MKLSVNFEASNISSYEKPRRFLNTNQVQVSSLSPHTTTGSVEQEIMWVTHERPVRRRETAGQGAHSNDHCLLKRKTVFMRLINHLKNIASQCYLSTAGTFQTSPGLQLVSDGEVKKM